jgi:hypothetical protein
MSSKNNLSVGQHYTVPDFVERARQALKRVAARYGHCAQRMCVQLGVRSARGDRADGE